MPARPGHIHLSSLSRRELHRRRRRRWLAAFPGVPAAVALIVAEATLVVAVWAERLLG